MTSVNRQNNSGFTIVELLIVIIIIGILAIVTFVAYTGIQQRARNAQTSSAAQEYRTALARFAIDYGRYPTVAAGEIGVAGACLGDAYAGDICWASNIAESATLSTILKSYMVNLPMPAITAGGQYNGVIFLPATRSYTLDGVGNNRDWLVYALQGSGARCEVGPVASYVSGFNLSSTPPANGQSTTSTTTPTCWIALPKLQ